MSDDRELLEIQQQLEEIMQRIGRTFNADHPRCNDIYEDVGAAVYYIEQAGYCLKAVGRKLNIDLKQ